MKKTILSLFTILVSVTAINAQSKGVKIGYIDMEYILQNIPEYAEAKNQLDIKAQKWKQEIEVKKNEIAKLKEALKTEQVLLTKELFEERQEEIKNVENEMLDYQQKRFGPTGDLIIQKSVLVKPIQDQIFTAVQDLAEKKYDFIFDKSSDLTMLFAAKKYDISDYIVRVITRAAKRQQLTKKQLKAEEAKEYNEDLEDVNPAMAERQRILDEKKAARDKQIADRKAAADLLKKERDDKRKQLLLEKQGKKSNPESNSQEVKPSEVAKKQADSTATISVAEQRKKTVDDRRKALDEKRAKLIQQRDSIKKARLNKIQENKTN